MMKKTPIKRLPAGKWLLSILFAAVLLGGCDNREPGFPGVYAYEAAQVVLTALRSQGRGQPLKEAVLSIRQFEGLQMPFSFDDFGDAKRSNASISVIRNQQFIVVE